jgi:hypothetical protein
MRQQRRAPNGSAALNETVHGQPVRFAILSPLCRVHIDD